MNTEQDKFSQVLRDKFSPEHFPFEDANWEKAEKMLDKRNQNKKRRGIALIFLCGLLAGTTIMALWLNSEMPQKDKTVLVLTDKNRTKDNVESNPKKDDKPLSEKVEMDKNTSATDENKTEQVNMPVEETRTDNINMQKDAIPSVKKNNAVSANNRLAAKTPDKKEELNRSEPATAEDKNVALNSNAVSVMNTQPIKQTDSEVVIKSAVMENQTSPVLVKDSSAKILPQLSLNNTVTPKKDSLVNVVNNTTPAIKAKAENNNIVSINAGTNYVFGWTNGNTKEGAGFNPALGIGLTHFFNAKWAIYSGIQYNSVGYLNASQKTYSTTATDFGAIKIDTVINTKWIHYITIPVFMQYHVDDKNTIWVGGKISYLATTTSDFTTTNYSDFKTPVEAKSTVYGYTQGFNQWDVNVSVAYSRKITGRLSISGEGHFGLLDIKSNAFFGEQKLERSSGIAILLYYDICKH